MEFMALFFTHSGAVKYDRLIKSMGLKCELMPVPRKLSSNCGIGARFTFDGNINKLISEDIEKLFEVKGKDYVLLYETE